MEKKEVIITPEIQEKFKNAIRYFNSRTIGRSGNIAPDYYCIVGCGILREPTTQRFSDSRTHGLMPLFSIYSPRTVSAYVSKSSNISAKSIINLQNFPTMLTFF
ncbi:MAG: hypothetical protein GTN73_03230 [Candidatus Aminicenantes bacterium]|nr:hypothetical protein [Candidatus Aminicenantes bacterium]